MMWLHLWPCHLWITYWKISETHVITDIHGQEMSDSPKGPSMWSDVCMARGSRSVDLPSPEDAAAADTWSDDLWTVSPSSSSSTSSLFGRTNTSSSESCGSRALACRRGRTPFNDRSVFLKSGEVSTQASGSSP